MYWKKHRLILFLSGFLVLSGLPSCITYYQRTLRYQEYVMQAEFDRASEWLQKDKRGQRPNNVLLHQLNLGWVEWMRGRPDSSNKAFSLADDLIEDRQVNPAYEALAILTNPMARPYLPEDVEVVLVNYYKALNYLEMQRYGEALVECRKINIKLNQLNDKYKDKPNRYSADAFAHLLMGMVYDATGDDNNAFIAYRNALETYEKVYVANFGVGVPLQLKKDLLRSAYRTGFREELRQYEEKFGMKYTHDTARAGELVFLWHNGFGPVKDEWSLNFTKLEKEGGWVTLEDAGSGVSVPFYTGTLTDQEKSTFADVHFLRIAFPRYLERTPVYDRALLLAGNREYSLEMAENVHEIAVKTLQDRMMRELATSLVRLAVKQSIEASLKSSRKEEVQGIGAAVSLLNALTEKADTRNWQTLPYAIHYARIPVGSGLDSLVLLTRAPGGIEKRQEFSFPVPAGKTRFFVYSSLENRLQP